MKKKYWLIIIAVSVMIIFFIIFSYSKVWDRLELVKDGLAKPNFPYTKYSQDELNKMYPQYVNENVATTQTPEQTHQKFVEALKQNDFDSAVQWFVPSQREEWKKNLEIIKEKGLLEVMIKDLDTKIDVDTLLETLATYSYLGVSDGGKFGHTIEFEKNSNGVWLIKSL